MSEHKLRIIKKEGEPSQFEYHIAQTLGQIEASSDLKGEMKDVYLTGATEFEDQNHNAVILMLHYRSLISVRKIHTRLTQELEKRFGRPVVMIFQRKILPKYLKKKGEQKRPYSRTLTQVHESILDDLVFPVNILGKRIRMKCDGKRVFKVILDPLQREDIEERLSTLAAVYRKLTNKEVMFIFPLSREFPNQQGWLVIMGNICLPRRKKRNQEIKVEGGEEQKEEEKQPEALFKTKTEVNEYAIRVLPWKTHG